MNRKHIIGLLHVIVQLLSQAVIIAVVPESIKPQVSAISAALGVIVAYLDQTLSD